MVAEVSLEKTVGPIRQEAALFARITLSASLLFLSVGSIAAATSVFFNSPVATGLGVLIIFLLLPLCVTAHVQTKRGHLDRAVTLISTAFYLIAAGMVVVGERLYGVLIVACTVPVLVSLPFVSQKILRRLILVSISIILVGSVGALFPPIITPTVPDRFVAYIQSFSTPVIIGVIMLSLWQSAGKLRATADGMREAIAGLQDSERLLESKVEERTQELAGAFQEISDVNEIAAMVNSTLDVDKVMDTIYNGLQSMFHFEQMGVFTLDDSDNRLRLRQQAGRPFPEALNEALIENGLAMDANDSFAAASVVGGQSIFNGNITREVVEAGDRPTDKLILQHHPLKSLLMCPLKIENRSIGCIYFAASDQAFDLSVKDIESIERYVTQLGTAVRNAQLFLSAEEARHEAESANETKGTFLANMSHEIRTPMNAIIGLTGLCLDTELNNKQQDYLTKVDNAANALRTIIDDILDFSKLEAGKFEFETIPFSLNEVLDNLATICMVRCQDKHLELVFQRDPGLPDILHGDPTRLGQILINLAGNAIKFTEEGQIVVEVRQVSQQDQRVSVDFDVRDSGIGMNEEQLGRLFQSFSQADSTISRQYGGTGLGLAISQQLTEMMGGKIEVTSAPGKGSSFHFSLSFEVADQRQDKSARQEELPQGLNTLVVDDNEASRDILQEYLLSFGYTVTVVESGEQALDQMQSDHSFDLLLLDWMMPGMTGLDVALAVREAPSPPKIVLLSSWDMPSSEHESMVDAFLAKPVKPSSLLDTIMLAYGKQVVQRPRKLGTRTGPGDLTAIRGARVLVVDDSDINLQIACELLEKVPLVLETAADGEQAVAKVNANQYDCVLMDIQMPRMDGYTATSILRQTYPVEQLPILAMTANVMAEDRTRTREAGMNGHVAKPVDPAELYQALLDAIPAADYSANLPADGAGPEVSPVADAPLPDSMPGLDISAGLSRLANNQSLFLQLLSDLVRDYSDVADTIQAQLSDGDMSVVSGTAHKVRGIANNLGAVDVGTTAEAIEKNAKAGENVSTAQIEALAQAIAVVRQSHSELSAGRQTVQKAGPASDVDVQAVLGNLKIAVASADPGATDFIDELLSAQKEGSVIATRLAEARVMLDNFDFGGAESLLADIEQLI